MVIITGRGVATASRRSPWRHLYTAFVLLVVMLMDDGQRTGDGRTIMVEALELGNCNAALGMESGAIKDTAISASSSYDSASVGPHRGRLQHNKYGGAWCPRHMVSRDAKEHLEVDLGPRLHVISGAKTQGRYGNGQGQEYAEEYLMEYWRPELMEWVRWRSREGKGLLQGNTNTFTVVEQKFEPPIIAAKVRFLPYSDHVRTVCMRVEVFGCIYEEGLLSYSGPQGYRRGTEVDLSDRTYDGREDSVQGGSANYPMLTGGLGQLVDGEKGSDNFRLEHTGGHGKGYEWVGWRNDTPGWTGLPVELLFSFDDVRNFSAAHLHTNNLFSKEVQVFSHARAYFSMDGLVFNTEPVYFSYMPDLILEHARNVTVKLHQRLGRYLKLQLYFATRWILVSEISFDSVAVQLVGSGNFSSRLPVGMGTANSNIGRAVGTDGSGTIVADPPTIVTSLPASFPNDANTPDQDTPAKEYSLQRDETKGQIRSATMATQFPPYSSSNNSSSDSKHYISFVIGILTVVIMILVVAIVLIVFRNQRLKATALGLQSSVPLNIDRGSLDEVIEHEEAEVKMPMEEYDKPALYQESVHSPYARDIQTSNTEVPDVINKDYGIPSSTISTNNPIDIYASARNYLCQQQAPPIPPPPIRYYNTGQRGNTTRSHYMLPHSSSSYTTSVEGSSSLSGDAVPQSQPSTLSSNITSISTNSHLPLPNATYRTSPVTPPTSVVNTPQQITIPPYPNLSQLRLVEHLGEGQFGDVRDVCDTSLVTVNYGVDTKNASGTSDSDQLVLVCTLRDVGRRAEFEREVKELVRLGDDANIAKLIGASLETEPLCAIREHTTLGDLCQFLQEHVAETATPLSSTANTLSYGCLIYMATQIASGMKHLESIRYIHKDLATRNCLVGFQYTIKISDLGSFRQSYAADYYQLAAGSRPIPIRWMSWESILMGKYTSKSDVWSFAVALWEILTFAREQPFEELSDEKVIENVTGFYQDNGNHMLLSIPINCPREIYDLMVECWQRSEVDRPTFREIHLFLQRKNLGYTPELH